MKPGWKTTEFWLTLATNAVGALSMTGQLPLPENVKQGAAVAGGVLSGLTTAAYAISRALAKRGAPDPAAGVGVAGGGT